MIVKLHQSLINKIAAGEIVERPASVLKELIENSIDAGASKITINIEKAGSELIEIIDSGTGMDKEDATIAWHPHTTSKITTLQDLDNINTMGFRGEALASISAVSKFTLITKSKKDKVGTKVTIDHGKKVSIGETTANTGTQVAVKKLFEKIPGRKKFLKTSGTEYKHILLTFYNYALAYPHIHFILNHNHKCIYNLPQVTGQDFNKVLKIRLNDLLKKNITDNLIEINYDAPKLKISGLLGHPSTATSHKSYQSIFLNSRPITDKFIPKAIYDAYQGLIPKFQYPIFFLFIHIDPSSVDVNVHPRKSEVRFENPQQIYYAVKNTAKQTLLKFLQRDTKQALKQYKDINPASSYSSQNKSRYPATKTSKSTAQHLNFRPKQPESKRTISKALAFTRNLLEQKQEDKLKCLESHRSFQVFDLFIIIEKKESLLIIDQHAAAERVTFEKLQNQLEKNKLETQSLLLPEIIELNTLEYELLVKNKKNLIKLGITLVAAGKQSFKIEEIPALIAKANIKQLLNDIISELISKTQNQNFESFEKIKNHIIATMACHTSIRGGMHLQREEIDHLTKELLQCENPYSCPHGRPIIWKISRNELAKKFERA